MVLSLCCVWAFLVGGIVGGGLCCVCLWGRGCGGGVSGGGWRCGGGGRGGGGGGGGGCGSGGGGFGGGAVGVRGVTTVVGSGAKSHYTVIIVTGWTSTLVVLRILSVR